jgi:uncharacterized membrane protein
MNALRSLFCSLTIIVIFIVSAAESTFAQCPMCRASAEASIKEGSSVALGLNDGILYLLAMPYLVVATLAYLWYRNYRKNQSRSNG